jgi:alanine racemase
MRQLFLDADALKHNFSQVKARAPHSKILAMVKANAYGHGLTWAAKHLQTAGADGFGVATMAEADILRAADITKPIVLMSGVQTLEELEHTLKHNYSLMIHNEAQLQLLEQVQTNRRLIIWLKIDTGMHRLGFAPDQLKMVWQRLEKIAFIDQPIILTTHFSDANEVSQSTTARQLMLFNLAKATLPDGAHYLSSLANSAGILSWPDTHADWVRPGIMLYGASPFATHIGADYQLRPVMSVTSEVIAIKDLAAGSQVGYAGTFTCPKAMRMAVIAFGYGDGYPWHAHLSQVLIRGHQCQVIGRISMDMLHVDISEFPEITLQDPVTLWGENLPVEALSVASTTIPYEIFCRLQRHRLKVAEGS